MKINKLYFKKFTQMNIFFQNIIDYFNFYIFFIILFLSIFGIFIKKDLFQKLMCLGLFQTNIILFFLSIGFNKNFKIPILDLEKLKDNSINIESLNIENPIPHVLMLTAIVVGLATFVLGLAILLKSDMRNQNEKE
jgi:multicomponent Na+:H+ antiporter subunit C